MGSNERNLHDFACFSTLLSGSLDRLVSAVCLLRFLLAFLAARGETNDKESIPGWLLKLPEIYGMGSRSSFLAYTSLTNFKWEEIIFL